MDFETYSSGCPSSLRSDARTPREILITSDSAYWHGDILHQYLLNDITSRGHTVEVIPYKSFKACVYERFFKTLSFQQQQDLETKFSNNRADIKNTIQRAIETLLQDYSMTVALVAKCRLRAYRILRLLVFLDQPRRRPSPCSHDLCHYDHCYRPKRWGTNLVGVYEERDDRG